MLSSRAKRGPRNRSVRYADCLKTELTDCRSPPSMRLGMTPLGFMSIRLANPGDFRVCDAVPVLCATFRFLRDFLKARYPELSSHETLPVSCTAVLPVRRY